MPETIDENLFCEATRPTLHHTCLFVPDLDQSVAFYTKALGLTLREWFDDIIGVRGDQRFHFNIASVFLEAGDGRFIELHPSGDGELQPPGFPMNHIALGVTDVDAVYERALKLGGNAYGFSLPTEDWDGAPLDVIMSGKRSEPMRMAFLQGPSGELIELYQAAN